MSAGATQAAAPEKRLCACTPTPLPLQVCDLASLAAIRALAEEWLASGAPLDLLINK